MISLNILAKREDLVLPVECVYAVIEVKALLNSQELQKVLDNMKSVGRLIVGFYGENILRIYLPFSSIENIPL
jgi:hypothetical protein